LGRHRAGEAFDVAALGAAPSQSANFFKRFQSADRVIDPLPDPFQCFADRSQRFFLELALAGSLRCKEYEKAANVVQLESSLLGTRLRGYNQVANLEKFLPISGRKRRARAQSSPISPGVHTPSPLTGGAAISIRTRQFFRCFDTVDHGKMSRICSPRKVTEQRSFRSHTAWPSLRTRPVKSKQSTTAQTHRS
jgi:hypothetical protein